MADAARSDLEICLHAFDGKNVSVLSEARVTCGDAAGYLDDLITLCRDPRPTFADGATWILKAELEDGLALPSEQLGRIIDGLEYLPSWQAQLHLCQSVEHLDLSEAQARQVSDWVRSLADHKRPFLRAWSLHARVTLGLRFDALHPDAEKALEQAEKDDAASVRARARNLRKQMS